MACHPKCFGLQLYLRVCCPTQQASKQLLLLLSPLAVSAAMIDGCFGEDQGLGQAFFFLNSYTYRTLCTNVCTIKLQERRVHLANESPNDGPLFISWLAVQAKQLLYGPDLLPGSKCEDIQVMCLFPSWFILFYHAFFARVHNLLINNKTKPFRFQFGACRIGKTFKWAKMSWGKLESIGNVGTCR